MTTYAKITDFASKDALLTGNPAKIVKGVEIDDEFNAIATADATSVKGPIGVTVDNTVVRWDGTTGRAVQGSGVTISDADVVTASGFTGPHNGTVGATTPSTGAFTTLSTTGNTTLGDASTDTVTVNGYMGVGGAAASNVGLYELHSALTGVSQYGIVAEVTGTSAATTQVNALTASPRTAAAAFTAANVRGLVVNNANKGAGSTITDQTGILVNDQTQGTNNYGITSLVSSGTNKWNIYAGGTAANYFAGNVGIGVTVPSNGAKLDVAGSIIATGSGLSSFNANNAGFDFISASKIGRIYSTSTDTTGGVLTFTTGQNGTYTERLRIDSAGLVSTTGSLQIASTQNLQWGSSALAIAGASNILTFYTNSVERLRIDSAGNLGLGVTPSAWSVGGVMEFADNKTIGFAGPNANIVANAYYNAGWKYKTTGAATYYNQATGQHIWYSAPSGTAGNTVTFTQAMTLDASGNLGLGVTPSAWQGSAKAIQLGNYSAFFQDASGYPGLSFNAVQDPTLGWKYTNSDVASRYSQTNGSHRFFTAPSGTAGNAISFTQAMTLDASGNLLVGTTSTSGNAGFEVLPNLYGAGAGAYTQNHPTGTATGTLFAGFNYNGTGIGSITQNGTTAVAFNTTSDHRLKENVRPADAARFMDIEFVDFEWTDGRHDCGVIAHQLQSVYPDLVIGEKDATEVRTVEITPAVPAVLDEEGNEVTPAVSAVTEEQTFPVYQQVNYIGLIGRMGTRIQQLQRTVDAQAAMLATFEARLSALEAA